MDNKIGVYYVGGVSSRYAEVVGWHINEQLFKTEVTVHRDEVAGIHRNTTLYIHIPQRLTDTYNQIRNENAGKLGEISQKYITMGVKPIRFGMAAKAVYKIFKKQWPYSKPLLVLLTADDVRQIARTVLTSSSLIEAMTHCLAPEYATHSARRLVDTLACRIGKNYQKTSTYRTLREILNFMPEGRYELYTFQKTAWIVFKIATDAVIVKIPRKKLPRELWRYLYYETFAPTILGRLEWPRRMDAEAVERAMAEFVKTEDEKEERINLETGGAIEELKDAITYLMLVRA
jgi:hypothetical protein